MKLTPNLKAVIVRAFKAGESMEYMASLYGVPIEKVEGVIRKAMIEAEKEQHGNDRQ